MRRRPNAHGVALVVMRAAMTDAKTSAKSWIRVPPSVIPGGRSFESTLVPAASTAIVISTKPINDTTSVIVTARNGAHHTKPGRLARSSRPVGSGGGASGSLGSTPSGSSGRHSDGAGGGTLVIASARG